MWRPGQSGNPGGRAKDPVRQRIKQLAGEHSEEALAIIWAIAHDESVPPAVRLNASNMILDRAVGKPVAGIQFEADEGTATVLNMIAHLASNSPLDRVKSAPKTKAKPKPNADSGE